MPRWTMLVLSLLLACGDDHEPKEAPGGEQVPMDASTADAAPPPAPRPWRCPEVDGDECRSFLGTPPIEGRFRMLAAGSGMVCGLRLDGSIRCFGSDSDAASVKPPPAGTFVELASAADYFCALDAAGVTTCWIAGYPTRREILAPLLEPFDGGFSSITLGGDFVCGLDEMGFARCHAPHWPDPWAPPDERFRVLDAGPDMVCGITLDGRLICWGAGGIDSRVANLPAGPFRSLSLAGTRLCVLLEAGEMHCENYYGFSDQCGSLPGEFESVAIAESGCSTCGILEDGGVPCDLTQSFEHGPYAQVVTDLPGDAANPDLICVRAVTGEVECSGSRQCGGCARCSTAPCSWDAARQANEEHLQADMQIELAGEDDGGVPDAGADGG